MYLQLLETIRGKLDMKIYKEAKKKKYTKEAKEKL